MTLKEQIMKLQTYKMYEGEDIVYVERDDVLKALEQQPSDDCVSRADVLALAEKGTLVSNGNYTSVCKAINDLPSVTPKGVTITDFADRCRECGRIKPCEDCISREAVMKCFKKWQPYMATRLLDYEQELKELPSVTPKYTDEEIDRAQAVEQAYIDKMVELTVEETERPKGKWIQTKDDCDGVNFYDFSFKCSKCGKEQSFKSNYCPNCGVDMKGSDRE